MATISSKAFHTLNITITGDAGIALPECAC